MLLRVSKGMAVFVLALFWVFSGWPRIWQDPPFPPGVRVAKANPDILYLRDATDENTCGAGADEEDLSTTQGSTNTSKALTTTGHSWWYQFDAETAKQDATYSVSLRGDHTNAGGSPSNRQITVTLRHMSSACAEQAVLIDAFVCQPNKGEQDWTCTGSANPGSITFAEDEYLLLEVTAGADGHNTLQYDGAGPPFDSFVETPGNVTSVAGHAYYLRDATDENTCGAGADEEDLSTTQGSTNTSKALTTTGHSWWYQFDAASIHPATAYSFSLRGDHSGSGGPASNRQITVTLRHMSSACAEQAVLIDAFVCQPNKGEQDWTCTGSANPGSITFAEDEYLLLEVTAGADGHNTLQYDGAGPPFDSRVLIPPPVTVSVAISDALIDYGILVTGASQSTLVLGDTQTVQNDGTGTEQFNIRGQDTACPWSLAASAGTDQYVHAFSSDSGMNWTTLTTVNQTLATSVDAGNTMDLDLRITVPTSTGCFDAQSADVTVQAVQP